MNTLASVANGLQGALLLARGRPEGLAVLAEPADAARTVAIRSFWAALLCLPAFICLQLMDLWQAPVPPHAARGFALQLLGYGIDWAGFALISHAIATATGRAALWPRFIAAWNWCNVVQYVLLVAASLPPLLGLPSIVGETAWLAASGWALWIEWYAARLALDITGVQAIGLVALDEALGIALLAIIGSVGT